MYTKRDFLNFFTRLRARRGASLLILVFTSIVAHICTRLNTWRYPMVGDDYLGIRVAQMPIRSGSFFENIWLVGGGKWRPITTSLLMYLGSQWGYEYRNFQILNSILLIAVAVAAGMVALQISSSMVLSVAITTVVVSSQFTWMAQTSIYGSMELLSALFVICSASCALRTLQADENSARLAAYSTLFLFAATLTHERYTIGSLVLAIFFLLQGQSKEAKRLAWLPVLIPLFYVVTRTFLLDLDPLAGGGESSLRTKGGPWIAQHLSDSFEMLFGGHSGLGVYYTPNAIALDSSRSDLGPWPVVGIALVVLFVGYIGQRNRHKQVEISQAISRRSTVFLLMLTVSSVIPAATVFERIEGRWLFTPQILLLLTILAWTTRVPGRRQLAVSFIFPAICGALSLYYAPNSSNYLAYRDQPSGVVAMVEKVAPSMGPWVLVISQGDTSVPTEWQFGYGNVFEQLSNPPYFTSISSGGANRCPKLKQRITCVVVRLNGLNFPQTVMSTMTLSTLDSLRR
ncbi:MAG: hypothetical protein EBU84_00660 [Actinobacteria bacterium]|nr:hypothetical protein [Actinomycetota bacterium]